MDWTAIACAGGILGGLGIVFGIILGTADKKFHVKEDDRIAKVNALLGGANCGACGYAGCIALAEAIVKGEAPPSSCPASGSDKVKLIGEIIGASAEAGEPMVARLACKGDCETAALRYNYDGIPNCRIANNFAGGPKMCIYACIGMGDCIKSCKFGAIRMNEGGLPEFDSDKCTGCGACIKQCPRQAIRLVPKTSSIMVACRNQDMAREARFNCKHACIGCKLCERNCPVGAISVNNNFAKIDFDKCTRCGKCASACPSKCIEIYSI